MIRNKARAEQSEFGQVGHRAPAVALDYLLYLTCCFGQVDHERRIVFQGYFTALLEKAGRTGVESVGLNCDADQGIAAQAFDSLARGCFMV